MAEIDSLEISIQASADKASKAIDGLIVKLDKLSSALDFGKNIAGIDKQKHAFDSLGETIRGVSGVMDTMKQSMRGISDSVAPQTQKMANTIARIANAGESSERAAKSLPKIGVALSKVTADMAAAKSIDSSVNRFASSIARLANAGDKSAVVAKELPKVGKALKDAADKMESVEGISDSTNTFTQSIAQLASTGDKAEKTASGLDQLADGTLRFFSTMKNAPQISENTIRMTQAMAQLSATGGKVSASMKPTGSTFKKVGESLKSLSNVAKKASDTIKKALSGIAKIVSGAFSKIGQIGLKASNTMKRVAGDMVAAFSRITHSSKGLNTASSNLSRLLKTIIGFKGIQGLFNFGKNAIKLGSDITEVENVVDTAFGSMAGHAYAFAATAKEQFGLSELAAKQYSGTMMAMLKSSGFDKSEDMMRQAAKMSTTLAGLAGDIASFYNLETDEAFYKLRSAISGETEPMKALGVNMNIVNLEAFAMSRGITKAYKDMTLAEQATLRYNYILAKTTDAQGDFAKTSGTWANQLRLLKLNFESISAVIGQGLIAAILPAIKWLNALMSKLMEAAKVFRSFMYTLFGKVEGSQGGVVDDLAGSLEDVGDEAEDAGKKIKKNLLLPIDELNILSEETKLEDDLGIGDFDIGDFELDEFEEIDTTPISKWAQAIRDAILAQDWEGLGKTLAELVNAGLQKIYDAIKAITPKVEQALKNFAKVFNSFVNWLDWDLLGKTIGAGINLIVKAFNALFGDDGINLELLGQKLSTGLRGMIEEVNWQELGNAIGNYLMIAWRIAYGFIEDMWRINPETLLTGWAEAGIAIGETLAGIFERIDFVKISSVLTEGFKGALETFTFALNTFSDNLDWIVPKINLGLDRLYDGLKWDSTAGQDMGDKITAFTDSVSTAFNKLLDLDFGRVGQIIGAGITDIVRAFNQLTDISGGIDFEGIGTNLSNALRGMVTEIPWGELGNALGNGFMAAWRILDGFLTEMFQQDGAGLTGWEQLGISIGNAVNGIFEKIDFETIANVFVMSFNGIIDALRTFTETISWEEISTNLTNGLYSLVNGIDWIGAGETISNLLIELFGVFQRVANDFDWEGFGRSVGEFLSSIDWRTIIGQVFDILWTVFSEFISGLFDTSAGKVILAFVAGLTALTGVFKIVDIAIEAYKWISGAAEILSGLGGLITTKVVPVVSSAIGLIAGEGGLFSKIVTAAQGAFSGAGILTKIGTVIFSPKGLLIAGIIAGVALIVANWDKVKEAALYLWENVLVPFGNFLKDVFTRIWEDMLKPAMLYIAQEVVPKLIETLRNFWDNVLEPLGKFIVDVFTPVFGVLSDVLMDLWKNVILPVADAVGGLFASAFKVLYTILNDVIIPVLSKIIDVLKIIWDKLLKPIVEWVRETLGPILETVFASVGEKISGLIEVLSGILDFLAGVLTGVGDVLSSVVKMVGDVLSSLGDIFSGLIDIIVGVFTGDWERAWNGVVDVFRGIFNLVPSIAEGVINGAIGLINGLINGINNITGSVGIPSIPNIPEISLPRFEMGGFPEDGLFLANHTELVGQFSNGRTAVANNAQITDGIRQASYEGMMQAMSEMFPYLADIAENTRRTAEKDMSVNIGDRDIYNANKRGAARVGMDFSDFSLA